MLYSSSTVVQYSKKIRDLPYYSYSSTPGTGTPGRVLNSQLDGALSLVAGPTRNERSNETKYYPFSKVLRAPRQTPHSSYNHTGLYASKCPQALLTKITYCKWRYTTRSFVLDIYFLETSSIVSTLLPFRQTSPSRINCIF